MQRKKELLAKWRLPDESSPKHLRAQPTLSAGGQALFCQQVAMVEMPRACLLPQETTVFASYIPPSNRNEMHVVGQGPEAGGER